MPATLKFICTKLIFQFFPLKGNYDNDSNDNNDRYDYKAPPKNETPLTIFVGVEIRSIDTTAKSTEQLPE